MGKKSAPVRAAEVQAKASRRGLRELRRQFDISREDILKGQAEARADLDPYRQAGAGGLQRFEQAGTVQGLGQNLADIFESGALDPLIQERTTALRGQLGAAGLSRSGTALQEAANIPTGLGFQIEQLLSGRSQDLANIGLGAATGTANVAQGAGRSLAGLSSQLGQQVLGTQQQIGQSAASGILGQAQAQGQFWQGALGLAGLFFSDPRLKKNVVKVGEIQDLGIYQWDWIDEVQDMAVAQTPTLGFMADEVAEKRPEYCKEIAGFKCIAYTALTAQLEYELDQLFPEAA